MGMIENGDGSYEAVIRTKYFENKSDLKFGTLSFIKYEVGRNRKSSRWFPLENLLHAQRTIKFHYLGSRQPRNHLVGQNWSDSSNPQYRSLLGRGVAEPVQTSTNQEFRQAGDIFHWFSSICMASRKLRSQLRQYASAIHFSPKMVRQTLLRSKEGRDCLKRMARKGYRKAAKTTKQRKKNRHLGQ